MQACEGMKDIPIDYTNKVHVDDLYTLYCQKY